MIYANFQSLGIRHNHHHFYCLFNFFNFLLVYNVHRIADKIHLLEALKLPGVVNDTEQLELLSTIGGKWYNHFVVR